MTKKFPVAIIKRQGIIKFCCDRENQVMTATEEDSRMAKAIVSQHVILCRDKQLNKRQELEKTNMS